MIEMKLLAEGKSKHHLFTYHDVRAKLVEVYGSPQTDDDHQWLHKECRRIHRQGETVMIDFDFHTDLHRKQSK